MGKVLRLTAILAFAAFALAVLGVGALRAQGPLPDAAASFREQEARMGAGPGTVVLVAIICLPRLGVLLLPWVALQFSRTFGSVGCAARWISFRAHTHCKKITICLATAASLREKVITDKTYSYATYGCMVRCG